MVDTAPRTVRVARRAPTLEGVEGSTGSRSYILNRHGTQRGTRLFLLFAGLLIAIFATFAYLLASGPASSASGSIIGILGVVAALLLGWAWWITAARAPKGVRWLPDGSVVVLGTLGRQRRYPASRIVRVSYRYPPSLFNQGPVELVEVSDSGKGKRPYLVNAGSFDGVPSPGGSA